MKTFYLLAALLGLQFNTLFAAVTFNESTLLSKDALTGIALTILAPVTPAEATFDDVVETSFTGFEISALAPAVPMIADFSDGAPVAEFSTVTLAPVTPKEADFEDAAADGYTTPAGELSPATPASADFEDHI